jgi:adenosylmethionine---8-amino-7-oxononanoate aminotransferase
LQIFDEDDVINHNRALAKMMGDAASPLKDHPHVGEVRQTGMILALELVKDKKGRIAYPWQERRGLKVYRYALDQGVLLRPLVNVVYFMPPYVISPEQICLLAEVAQVAVDRATY